MSDLMDQYREAQMKIAAQAALANTKPTISNDSMLRMAQAIAQHFDNGESEAEIIEFVLSLIADQQRQLLDRLDPFNFVEPCEPECSPERHAYHQGQWDMAVRMEKKFKDIREGLDALTGGSDD